MTNLDHLSEELRNQILASQKAYRLATELHEDLSQRFPVCDLRIGVSGMAATVTGIIDDLKYNDEITQYLIHSGKVNELNVEFTLMENETVVNVTINKQSYRITSLAQLQAIISKHTDTYQEYSMSGHGERSLLVLFNPQKAMAIYFNYPGDSGFSTNNPNGAEDVLQDFLLSNGQRDEYPESMLIDHRPAHDILRYYLLKGDRYADVVWVEE